MTLTEFKPSTTPAARQGGTPVVVVGIDGSPASDQALLFAIKEAQLRRATLRIVSSHDPAALSGYAGSWSIVPFEDGLREACATMVADAATTVASATTEQPVVVETTVASGRASRMLLDASHDADLLVIGSRGAGALSRMMMGSTCTEVVHHAHVPVVVVPSHRDGVAH